MSTTTLAADAPDTDFRGRMQRRLRRRAQTAPRDSLVAIVITATIMAFVQVAGFAEGTPADEVRPIESDGIFSAVIVGDVMFARHVEEAARVHGHDWLFSHVAPLLDADYVSGNLEQVVSDRLGELPRADKLIHLGSDARGLQAMADAGFTTVTLANNHMMDFGIPGLRDTLEAVDEVGLERVGAGLTLEEAVEINYQEHDGLTVATLSFSDAWVAGFVARAFQGGVLDADPNRMFRLIGEAKANADLVIAQFHWGTEYAFAPNERQRDLAEIAASAGADLVIGHHPHVLQSVERIGDTLVAYSLGNFVFDQGWSRTRETALLRYDLGEDGMARVSFVPLVVREGAPRVADGPLGPYRRMRIFQRLSGDGLPWWQEDGVLVTEIDHRNVLESANR